MDKLEAVTKIMCDAIDRSEVQYVWMLEQMYNGITPSAAASERLASLDKEALAAVEMYYRFVADSVLDDTPRF